MTDAMSADQEAFEAFASAYPHEVHDEWPDRFWEFFQRVRPGMSREDMVRLLNETRCAEPVTREAEGA